MPNENPKLQKDKETILSIIKYTLISVIVIAVLYLGFRAFLLLMSVVIGFVLAYLSNKFSTVVFRLIFRKSSQTDENGKDTRGFKILKLVNYTFFLLCFTGLVILLVFILISQIRNLLYFFDTSVPTTQIINSIRDWLNEYSRQLGGFLPESTISTLYDEMIKMQTSLLDAIPKWTSTVLNSILGFISNIPTLVFQGIAIVMSGYYFISDRIVILKFIHEILPSELFVNKFVSVISKVSRSLFRYFGGYTVILTITFLEALLGLSLIRMPYTVVIALIVTVIDILPAVGASACFLPIGLYMFTQGRVLDGIIAFAFVVIMTVVRSFIEPKIIGNAMKLHPLLTLVAMILGVYFFGIAGFLGGPILLIFILGIMDSFGFRSIFKEWVAQILNKVATADERPEVGCAPPEASVKHIVAWKLKDELSGAVKDEFIAQMKERLLSLPPVIPQILSFEFGTDTKFDSTAFDCVLIATFASYESLSIYKNHPAHKEVSHWIRQNISSRSVVDFNL